MTVSISYEATPVLLQDGRYGVRLEREVKKTVKTTDMYGFRKTVSLFNIILTVEDALEMVRAYREREFRILDDVDNERKEICLNMIPGESFCLEWWEKGKVIEDDLWSDWPDDFMTEVESVAKEVQECLKRA